MIIDSLVLIFSNFYKDFFLALPIMARTVFAMFFIYLLSGLLIDSVAVFKVKKALKPFIGKKAKIDSSILSIYNFKYKSKYKVNGIHVHLSLLIFFGFMMALIFNYPILTAICMTGLWFDNYVIFFKAYKSLDINLLIQCFCSTNFESKILNIQKSIQEEKTQDFDFDFYIQTSKLSYLLKNFKASNELCILFATSNSYTKELDSLINDEYELNKQKRID